MRCLVNPAADRGAVPPPSGDAAAFHAALPRYRATPVQTLPGLAAELGVRAVAVKDESDRLGLPAFKVLGAAWAVERTLREHPEADTLVAASAGNHGRAVAHVAAQRGLRCRIFLPARSVASRRDAIAAEGAEVVIVEGSYEDAVARAIAAAAQPGALEIADVEPATAACLTASLAAGRPTAVPTPGTVMAGLDCAEVSVAAWPSLQAGMHGTITVDDAETRAAVRVLADAGLAIGESGAAPLAALRALVRDPRCSTLRSSLPLGPDGRILLVATEGPTDPAGYRRAVALS